ncbi:type II CAAX endopeptidase family protein [Amycolatopsis sp. SID8362]|uniref:CPBP family intramembrane glutamic endopeptidase n=1 Tax=Amycolatopsis sp. SID8362 TaxID=2690346 RepID=UPI00136C9F5D|nr:type II CAAX endopeptidase family protein [Amycolatopsis sp. SID8362]NBH09822.1 CPBP family intramembrane metalloprotease [Amycolatopsis sp. SID8362]NED46515.1 CPBP family intramembrane metalloprotease [Amycolatopsis sp. SID8362]
MRLLWQLLAVAAIAFLGSQAANAVTGNPWLTLVVGTATAVLAVMAYRWVVRRTEQRPVTELARPSTGLVWGTLVGIALFAAVIANIALLGDYEIRGWGTVTGAIGLLGFMAAAAATEELLFRGVLFRIIEERTGTWIALVLTAVLFGSSHLFNEHATLWGALAIAIEAGGLLTSAYIATRKLWLPMGVHFGWNFAAAGLFGTEVSGNGTPQGLLDAVTSGPVAVTGGAFGPEGSLYSLLFCLLGTGAFLWLAHRRGTLVPRRRAERVDAVTTLSR